MTSQSAFPTVTDAVFAHALATDPAGPLITFYDDATGERTELSTITTANWAAKTANLIRDEFGLVPGDTVAVDLPAHWQTLAVLLGAWWAGCEVVIGPAAGAAAAFCSLGRLEANDSGAEIAVAPLDPFARPVSGLPIGVTDFGSAVRVHGDQFAPVVAGPLALDGRGVTEIIAAAQEFATVTDIGPSSRILSTRHWDTADNVVTTVLATPIAGGSLVQVVNPDVARLAGRAASEKVTATLS